MTARELWLTAAAGVRRVIQDLMRGNSPSKTSTLQDLDRYVREPRYKGMKAPVRPCLGSAATSEPRSWRALQASQKRSRSCHGTALSGLCLACTHLR